MAKVKVVFIASLSHSGSTLLDIILGKHPSVVGMGEVRNVLGPGLAHIRAKGTLCSCGKTVDQCEFWGRVSKKLDQDGEMNIKEQYSTVLKEFGEVFGTDQYFVDASKKVQVINILRQNPDVDLRVIHLIKDVRSFTLSAVDRVRKRREKSKGKSSRLRVPWYFFWVWYRDNRAIQRFAKKHDIPTLQIGYEELCLQTKPMLEKVCAFLGVEPTDHMLSPALSGSRSHVMRGNEMRHNLEGKSISYDYRWFHRREWISPAFFFRWIMRYNSVEAYRNTTKKGK